MNMSKSLALILPCLLTLSFAEDAKAGNIERARAAFALATCPCGDSCKCTGTCLCVVKKLMASTEEESSQAAELPLANRVSDLETRVTALEKKCTAVAAAPSTPTSFEAAPLVMTCSNGTCTTGTCASGNCGGSVTYTTTDGSTVSVSQSDGTVRTGPIRRLFSRWRSRRGGSGGGCSSCGG